MFAEVRLHFERRTDKRRRRRRTKVWGRWVLIQGVWDVTVRVWVSLVSVDFCGHKVLTGWRIHIKTTGTKDQEPRCVCVCVCVCVWEIVCYFLFSLPVSLLNKPVSPGCCVLTLLCIQSVFIVKSQILSDLNVLLSVFTDWLAVNSQRLTVKSSPQLWSPTPHIWPIWMCLVLELLQELLSASRSHRLHCFPSNWTYDENDLNYN